MNIKTLADDVIHAVRDFVSRSIGPLEARLQALEARPVPQDGKSVTVEEFRGLLNDIVEERIKALPAPKDGTSVTLDDVLPVIEAHLKAIPAPKDGTSVTLDDVRPLVEAAVAAIPRPKDGSDGKSVTLEEVRAYLDAEIATWALGFERRAQDVLQRAIDKIPAPKDGRDGLGVEDFDIALDGRDLTVTITRGDFTKSRTVRIPALLDAGVFREGTAYEKGDCVSFGGSTWIAQKDAPEGKPGTSDDWRLAVKKGRDGKDWSGPK